MNNAGSFSDRPKKLGRPPKNKKIQTTAPETSLSANLPASLPSHLSSNNEVINKELQQTLANIIQNGAKKYGDIANNQLKETRNDFEVLLPIVSEFLENFMIIGHSLDGQRVVARYTKNPAGIDALTELCKKVLVNMMIQEQNGE